MCSVLSTAIVGKAVELTGIWGVKYMLKIMSSGILQRIKSQMMIDVPESGHFVRYGEAEKSISFKVIFTRPYPAKLAITHIDYQILYGNKVRQRNQWKKSIILDKDTLRVPIELFYYPLESPLGIPASPSGWKLTGITTIECIYGRFEKEFESKVLTVDCSIPWEKLANEVQNA